MVSDPPAGKHAVVVGGSIAGLLAAQVVADICPRVTIIERDPLDDGFADRPGVPHGRHAHALLPKGASIIGDLVPGIFDELERRGALRHRVMDDYRFSFAGGELARASTGRTSLSVSRPCLEGALRERVLARPGVTLAAGHTAVGLDVSNGRVAGVLATNDATGAASRFPAGLVVDASGRACRAPVWLTAMGLPRPPVEETRVDIAYASCLLKIPEDELDPRFLVLSGPRPGVARGGALFAVEGGHWILSVGGYAGDHPPHDLAGFVDFAATIFPADVAKVVAAATQVTGIATHRFPTSRRRRFEQLPAFAPGFYVIGDAMCSLNPLYGQGMTAAAIQAAALRDTLTAPRSAPSHYFRAAARAIDPVWQLAKAADLAIPGVPGHRSPLSRAASAYVTHLQQAAWADPVLAEQFMRVSGLLDPPWRLMLPAPVIRTLASRWRSPAAPQVPRADRAPSPATTRTLPARELSMANKLMRALAAVTAVWGATLVVYPDLLTKMFGLSDSEADSGKTADQRRAFARFLGLSDTVAGVSTLAAPRGELAQRAAAMMLAANVFDATQMSARLPPRSARASIAISGCWSALIALALFADLKQGAQKK